MKNHTIAAALIVASFSALADGATYQYPQPIASNVSRAEVQAQTVAARSQGELVNGEFSYVAPTTGQAMTRQGVKADLATARANDELASGERGYVWEAHAHRNTAQRLQKV